MPLPKCQCLPDLDSVLRKARVNEIGECLLTSKKIFNVVIFCSLERPNPVRLYSDRCQNSMPFFCSCHISLCFTCCCFILSFIAKKSDLNSFDISARLNVFCAFVLNVEICFQCFDSIGWSSGRMLSYSLNVCVYISDRLRVFGCYTRCAINTALC